MSVALVDLLPASRIGEDKGRLNPFVLGLLRQLQIPAAWLCLPRSAYRLDRSTLRAELEPEGRRWLTSRLRALGATHVLLSEAPTAALEAELRALTGAAPLSFILPGPCESADATWLTKWLTLPLQEGRLPDLAPPLFEAEAPTPLSSLRLPPTTVLAGRSCAYAAPLRRNPHYRDVDLSGCSRQGGCAFCIGPDEERRPFATPPLELALEQIVAAQSARSAPRDPHSFQLVSTWLVAHLDQLAEALVEREVEPSTFHVSTRADTLVHHLQPFERGLDRCRDAGHQVRLSSIGAESFSPKENERLNKGLTQQLLRRALDELHRLERSYGETFEFSSEGGLGFILFTPWTTAEDLRQNVDVALDLDLEHARFLLTRRLMLLPDLPITALAQRDGLTRALDTEDRSLFELLRACDPGCRHWAGEEELPWRFASAETRSLCAVILELAEGPDDRLLQVVDELLELARARPALLSSGAALRRGLDERLQGRWPQGHDGSAVAERQRKWVEALRRLCHRPSSPLRGLRLEEVTPGARMELELSFRGEGGRVATVVISEPDSEEPTVAVSGDCPAQLQGRLLEVATRVCRQL